MRQNNRAVLTAIDLNGFTCAHIAAVKGSYAVVKELMMIDKAMVIQVCFHHSSQILILFDNQ